MINEIKSNDIYIPQVIGSYQFSKEELRLKKKTLTKPEFPLKTIDIDTNELLDIPLYVTLGTKKPTKKQN